VSPPISLERAGKDQDRAGRRAEHGRPDALREFEIEMGMVTPETAGVTADDKELGAERLTQTQG
jgi:hypothetical protein